MAEAVGLSIGAARFAGVQLGRAPVTRESVLTLYQDRSPELGVPGENSNVNAPAMVVTGFVDRVGDPVGMVAADGSMHHGELLVADALRELCYTVTGGRPPAAPLRVTYPTHWRTAQVDALRIALTHVPEWSRRGQVALVSDAEAAICALQSAPGVPARGVIALCDFGGTGTSITLLDATRGYAPVGRTVRHTDFSGDLIDQALLTHVVTGLSGANAILTSAEATGTSALGPLHRLRGRCRGAKERLSATTVTALSAELPGFRGDVRLTRSELEDHIRSPLTELLGVLKDAMDRSGVRPGDLAAVASVGGGARIPLVTEMLSERFRVPVITPRHPELAAAAGAALRAEVAPAAMAATVVAPAAAAASAFADADAASTTFRALAWSEAHDVPPLAPAVDSYDEPALDAAPTGLSSARPQFEFGAADAPVVAEKPCYRRRSSVLGVAASVLLLLGTSAVVAFGSDSTPASSTSPLPPPASAAPSGAAAAPQVESPAAEQPQVPAPRTLYAVPAPETQYQAPAQQQAAAPPQAVAPSPAAPPPSASSEPPPPPPAETTTVTSTTQAPPSTTTVTAPPPTQQPSEPTQAPAPPTTTQPPLTFPLPPLPSIPGLFAPQGNR